jgi:CubicO group peptidase (beta-lactamase class C family)
VAQRASLVVVVAAACAARHPQSLTTYLDDLAARGAFTGAIRVERDGAVLADRAYGLADEDRGVANTTATAFRIGSNTKQFTAMAILLLQDAGQLSVDDPICRYLAPCPAAWTPITIQHLLDHASGIPDYTNAPDFPRWIGAATTVGALIARFRDLPLAFAPGTRWSYSNSGYVLLGAIVTQLSGAPYASFVRDHIFAPLGMADTAYDDDHPPAGHAAGYLAVGVPPVFVAMSEFDAAGALASTTADLARWDRALIAGAIGSPAARAALLAPHIACPPGGCALADDVGYGDGWFIAQLDGHRYTYHWGRIDGFKSSNGFYDDDIAVIVLSNLETVDTFGIATQLGQLARAP